MWKRCQKCLTFSSMTWVIGLSTTNALPRGVHVQDERQWTCWNTGKPLKLLDCEGDQISQQLGQMGCGAPKYCWRYPKPSWIWPWESCLGLDNPLWCLATANPWDADITDASTVSTAQGTLPWHWGDTWSICAALWASDPLLSSCSLANYSLNFTLL